MDKTLEIIEKHKDERIQFTDQVALVEIVRKHKVSRPDISIETCKAIIESISKQVICVLDRSRSTHELNGLDFSPIFRIALESIAENCKEFEVELTRRMGSTIARLAEIRNERGEISHGKVYPKAVSSSNELAELVIQMTDAVLVYVLTSFYSVDLNLHLPIEYSANPEFNENLDSRYPEIGISYSQALYDQDYIQYAQLLLEYNESSDSTD